MKHWTEELLEHIAAGGRGHLIATFGESGCFSEEWSSIDLRWNEQDCFARVKRDNQTSSPPVHLDPAKARALAQQLFDAGALEEPDVGRSTCGAVVRFEGEYAPVRGQSVSFRVELRASMVEEPSRRLIALEHVVRGLVS